MSYMTYKNYFNSWAEFIDCAKNKPQSMTSEDNVSEQIGPSETRFRGSESMEQTLDFVEKGWEEGLKEIKDFKSQIPINIFDSVMPVLDYRPELSHSISGGILDVPLHISGASPLTFLTESTSSESGEIRKGNKLQSILFNISNSSYAQKDCFFYRGALAYHLIEHMEQCGYSCEVWVYCTALNDAKTNKLITTVKIKDFGELFDTNKLCIALSSMFMSRRLIFRVDETLSGDIRLATDRYRDKSYGLPSADKLTTKELPSTPDSNPLQLTFVNKGDYQDILSKFKSTLDSHLSTTVVKE